MSCTLQVKHAIEDGSRHSRVGCCHQLTCTDCRWGWAWPPAGGVPRPAPPRLGPSGSSLSFNVSIVVVQGCFQNRRRRSEVGFSSARNTSNVHKLHVEVEFTLIKNIQAGCPLVVASSTSRSSTHTRTDRQSKTTWNRIPASSWHRPQTTALTHSADNTPDGRSRPRPKIRDSPAARWAGPRSNDEVASCAHLCHHFVHIQ